MTGAALWRSGQWQLGSQVCRDLVVSIENHTHYRNRCVELGG